MLSVPEILEHPHLAQRLFLTSFPASGNGATDTQHVTGAGFQLDGEPAIPSTPAPKLSEHTASWLSRLGYDDNQIAALREEGTI